MKKFLWKAIDVFSDWALGGAMIALGLIIFSDGFSIIKKYM